MSLRIFTIAFFIAGGVGAASATSTTLVDFTDRNVWSGKGASATYQASYGTPSNPFTVTLTTNPGASANFTEDFDGVGPSLYCQANGGPLACISDGLGIIDDEITAIDLDQRPPLQSATLTFSKPVFLYEMHFLDVFKCCVDPTFEVANAYFDGDFSTLLSFPAQELFQTDGGYVFARIDGRLVSMITVFSGATNDGVGMPDIALAAVRVAPIPLPAAGWLLLSGLAGLGVLGRKKPQAA